MESCMESGYDTGEPGAMTLKALRIIRSCDVIVLPAASKEACYAYRIVYEVCPEIEEKILLCMPFPMIQDEKELELAHEKNYHEIEDYLRKGKDVGMLTIGIQVCIRHICTCIIVLLRQIFRQL